LALEKQLSSIPTSLTVAGAELRVMEAKLEEHQENYQRLQKEEQHKSAQIHKYPLPPSHFLSSVLMPTHHF
jgi:hypothetical protein